MAGLMAQSPKFAFVNLPQGKESGAECSFLELRQGDAALITGFREGDPLYRGKLLALGLLKGSVFQLTKMAPSGDPVEVAVRGSRLSLRRAEAQMLRLRRC